MKRKFANVMAAVKIRVVGFFAVAMSGALMFSGATAAMTDEELVARGLALLQKNCARCHAIALTGVSPHPQAPPFRDVVKRYPVEDLEESLAEGIMSGHPDMPEFTFNAGEIDAIIAYLNNLKAKETK